MSNYEREASIRPPIFDGPNFVYWKVRVIAYLQSLGTEVWDTIDTGYTFPSATPTDLAKKKKYETNAKVVNTLLGCLSQSEFVKVMQFKSTKEIWDKIVLSYEGDDQVKRAKLQTLTIQYENLNMYNDESVANYFLRVDEIVNCMKNLGEEIKEVVAVEKVLRSLFLRFESKVSAIEEKENLQNLKMSQLHRILTAYEMRNGGPSDKREATFKASTKENTMSRDTCQKKKKNQILSEIFNEVLEDSEEQVSADKGTSLKLQNMENKGTTIRKMWDSFLCRRTGKSMRLGHLRFSQIRKACKYQVVRGLPDIKIPDNTICKSCHFGKKTRTNFPEKGGSASRPLELVHIDVCGPFRTRSPRGEEYFILFIDDFSRMVWLGLMKHKDEAFEKFQSFKALVENESDYKIKCLRSDRGGEFTSNDFFDFCEEHGIRRKFSTARTPQQNGVVERMNRTVQQMARAMLDESGTPAIF
eukprot:PITA_23041